MQLALFSKKEIYQQTISVMRTYVTLDSTSFPIVVEKYSSFIPTYEEFVEAQLQCENYYRQYSNFILFVDLSDLANLPAEYRISQAKWLKRMKPLQANQKMRVVIYSPSMATRLLLKAMFVFAGRLTVPYLVASTEAQADAWVKKQRSLIAKDPLTLTIR